MLLSIMLLLRYSWVLSIQIFVSLLMADVFYNTIFQIRVHIQNFNKINTTKLKFSCVTTISVCSV